MSATALVLIFGRLNMINNYKELYFSHDYNPTNDPKIVCLLGEYGGLGYGLYWRIVEMLHSEETHKLPLKKFIFLSLAQQMRTDVEQIRTIVERMLNDFELFKKDGENYLYSDRVNRNIAFKENKSVLASNAGKKSGEIRNSLKINNNISTDVEQPLNGCEPTLNGCEPTLNGCEPIKLKVNKNKINNIKENIIKEKNSKIFQKPTIQKIQEEIKIKEYKNFDFDYFFNYWETRDWFMKDGKKMKNWRAAMVTWNKNNFQKSNNGANNANKQPNDGVNGYFETKPITQDTIDNLADIFGIENLHGIPDEFKRK